jgi:negative regulator of flagellin synthesis FlgM
LKIDPSAPSATPLSRTAKGGKVLPATGADAAEGAKESVQVSTGQVHSLPSSPSTDFDAARVASIREDIRAGRYEIHPERIAKGLLASVRDLLGGKKEL